MKGKTQERMERGSRKRSSSKKMERFGDRQGRMEGRCLTGQSPLQVVEAMEEEEEKEKKKKKERKKERKKEKT